MRDTGNSDEGRDILIVDDNARARQYMATLLSAIGHRVTTASDGSQALSLLLRGRFDLMITDLQMRPLDGYGLIALMRNLPQERRVPRVIICSAHVNDPAIQRWPQLRGAQLVAKPIHPGELLVAVSEALAQRNAFSDRIARAAAGMRQATRGLFRSARR
ncbi:MAG TPA: response regulator [Hyphomonadaceae bacterium]|nr:response regulator [Hyphomonadaceae bacterium]